MSSVAQQRPAWRLKAAICCLWILGVTAYCLAGWLTQPVQASAQEAAVVDFKRDVLPILEASCYQCHSSKAPQAELILDTKSAAMKGGISGKAIIPGKAKESLLVKRVLGEGGEMRMPPGKPLSSVQINTLVAWIDQGAVWPGEEKLIPAPTAAAAPATTTAAIEPVDFVNDIQPIFKNSCYACHSGEKPKAQLRLDSKTLAMKGGISGEVIIPGKGSESRLIHRVLGHGDEARMPLKGAPLAADQIALIRRWIDEGAPWPDSASVEGAIATHWAFVAPVRPALPAISHTTPWVRNPIDRFVLARLEKEKLSPSREASKETLIRRVSLDLTGLPPTPAEIDRFVADRSPEAYEKLVDRLLASPHYGERWGRHWLDAARYADSDGYEKDKIRQVWFYRDWVINALNGDLPYDQFVINQIAGDLLPNPTQEQLVATGFLRNSMINEEGGIEPEQFRMEAMFDRMDAVGKSVLGVTIQCAQCHNHKFDPLTIKEYYQLYAFLNNDDEPAIEVPTAEDERKR